MSLDFHAHVFDKLPELENDLPTNTKRALFYIAGYIVRKDELSERKHGMIIANILFKNYCYLYSPRSEKGTKTKNFKT